MRKSASGIFQLSTLARVVCARLGKLFARAWGGFRVGPSTYVYGSPRS